MRRIHIQYYRYQAGCLQLQETRMMHDWKLEFEHQQAAGSM